MTETSITIALSKGRILDETIPLLKEAGIEFVDDIKKSRKLVFPSTDPNVRLLIIRATDVPTYVQYGGADLGVTGKDVLLEHGGDGLYEPLDLDISRCRLMTAGVKGQKAPEGRLRVATKFVNLARRFYAAQGRQADIIKLYGAMELAPLLGLADEIVDIVDTGNTLKANGLEPRELIENISTRLVANRASMKMKHDMLQPIIEKMGQAVEARRVVEA
ncbi:ATP phosphoribosyltransferase [Marinobacter zhanjiangensis]|uniref:ATP phosphoribosyltransferase n=1 Tax=Marinobacter zhanjiangensis TaxID=578215 RepID=A0ABQ3AXL3_9GAMM|nr:ATP phosphoribosyltransferase [Marinobacter zhanjiangensis]GGY69546.1 ATP phosphoribosyltransferase [Marinobacter zhanjiangensis]